MGKRARMIARDQTPPESRVTQQPNVPTSSRCRATHDVPYTLRCVLPEIHVYVVVRSAIVQSGPLAGSTVTMYEPHQDKNGDTW